MNFLNNHIRVDIVESEPNPVVLWFRTPFKNCKRNFVSSSTQLCKFGHSSSVHSVLKKIDHFKSSWKSLKSLKVKRMRVKLSPSHCFGGQPSNRLLEKSNFFFAKFQKHSGPEFKKKISCESQQRSTVPVQLNGNAPRQQCLQHQSQLQRWAITRKGEKPR